jgi:membrane protease YdiL (CAAX protease family)
MRAASQARGPSGAAIRPLVALGALALAELLTQVGIPAAALAIDLAVLFASLSHAARRRNAERSLALATAVVALERPLSLAVPSLGFGTADSYLLLAIPTTIGIVLAARLAGYTRRDLGLVADAWVRRAAIVLIPIGLVIGVIVEQVARPLPIMGDAALASLGPTLVAIVVATGLAEELLYRGLVQRAATQRLGIANGVVYASVLYSALAWTPWTPTGTMLVFLIALALGTMTRFTGSVIPAVAAHTGLNVGLLLVGPLVGAGRTIN